MIPEETPWSLADPTKSRCAPCGRRLWLSELEAYRPAKRMVRFRCREGHGCRAEGATVPREERVSSSPVASGAVEYAQRYRSSIRGDTVSMMTRWHRLMRGGVT